MRSPARLVTGTAAALAAAALGLAVPSAHADGLGRPGLTAVPAAGQQPAGEEECDPAGAQVCEPSAPENADGTDPSAGLESGEPAPLDGLEPLGGTEQADEPAAPDALWPGTEDPAADEADTGTAAETLQRPGSGTGTDPGARPEPVPPGSEPGTARPPVPPGHRPTTAPSPSRPSGHVGTGVGGSAAPDTAQLATGAGLVAAAVLGGALLLRRRRADGPRH
ncbi:hypothetical protein [Streptomyces sp. NPDC048590]|uniref:hypothetical protein n=1 Tax=Streptomyces sp. NPDC048590 TaxID=3365574 RepID=UPI003716850E